MKTKNILWIFFNAALAALGGGTFALGILELPPLLIALVALGFALAHRLGPVLQQHITTEPDLGDLEIVAIHRLGPSVHLVITRNHAHPVSMRHG